MIDDRSASRSERALDDSFERYLQDEGKAAVATAGPIDATQRANSSDRLGGDRPTACSRR
ncbi:hypothetical protein C486_02503 [Natrinema gari JCM 14663]|uniref:Uncharacterized protein n=1 Tax=Natrinema gari JCM 14663 TaxID=1230459 RepID=L9Z9Y2_9EURY|nr:hypothetical protein [Natrinema gari]ELY83199.1 hypothetical protein C486_02503 [Natrinema gari JCM 14663]